MHKQALKKWITRTITDGYKFVVGDISIVFCSDEYLLQINQQYLQHDFYTDVITFDYSQLPTVSGDVLMSIDTIRRNAGEYHTTFEQELHRVMIHGILHLCGEKDKTPAQQKKMREAENRYLQTMDEK
ncbi:endoribonuclease YbeY [Bacteroidia bacterium]|nr:endoribonuclease YbeY [Bacteroidia bacterium]